MVNYQNLIGDDVCVPIGSMGLVCFSTNLLYKSKFSICTTHIDPMGMGMSQELLVTGQHPQHGTLLKPAFQATNVPWLSDPACFEGKQLTIYEHTLDCLCCCSMLSCLC